MNEINKLSITNDQGSQGRVNDPPRMAGLENFLHKLRSLI